MQSPLSRALSRLFALLLATAWLGGLAAPPAAAADAGCNGPTRLIVDVVGMRDARGEIAVTVYPDSAKAFLAKGGKLARQRVPTASPTTEACFALPAPGIYAVAIYHDENGDHAFGRNLLGLPLEGFGFSNDAPTPIGLPEFSQVRFKAGSGDTVIRIKLRYVSAPKSGL